MGVVSLIDWLFDWGGGGMRRHVLLAPSRDLCYNAVCASY